MLTRRRYWTRLSLCGAGLIFLLLIAPGIGTESSAFDLFDAWRAQLGLDFDRAGLMDRPGVDASGDGLLSNDELDAFAETARTIGFSLRFSRSLLALQVGATLALCGATFQVLFRNPLAEPYTLGIAGGGSLGALIAIRTGWVVSFAGFSSVTLLALIGGFAVVGLVYAIAGRSRRMTTNELILAGVAMGLFCSAMMMFVTAVSSERTVFAVFRWMMGSLNPLTSVQQVSMLPLLIPAWLVLIAYSRSLNQYRLGDEPARARGVHVTALRGLCVLVSTSATAIVVAQCGPVGFVGLVVPHIVALMVGRDCRVLLPASAILGGAFLILCDWGAQLAMKGAGLVLGKQLSSATLPVGVVTAVVGVPILIVLLRTRCRST